MMLHHIVGYTVDIYIHLVDVPVDICGKSSIIKNLGRNTGSFDFFFYVCLVINESAVFSS